MPDITMCNNKKCSKKNKCYRYMAKPSSWQSYSVYEEDGKKHCDQFMEIYKAKKKK